MKKTPKRRTATTEDLRPEYHFDYRKSRPNRFAERANEGRVVVVLDPDIAEVFTTPESVKEVLRALIATMPPKAKRKTARGGASQG